MKNALNIAQLFIVCDQIEGRKKLQKIVHLLQEAGFSADFPYRFGYLHYGPYSHELKSDLDLLTDSSGPLVNESVEASGLHQTYIYRPSEELREAFANASNPAWSPLALQLNKKSAQELEAISTLAFLRRSGVAENALRARFEELKPALANGFQSAAASLGEIGTAKKH